MDGWDVRSNAESGEGYSDISIEVESREIGIIIELKYAENATFDESCRSEVCIKALLDGRYIIFHKGAAKICQLLTVF